VKPSPATSRTRSTKVMDAIGRRIIEGGYPEEGALPPEFDLCQVFGVSRTPLREAMNRLAAKGLIVVSPKSGTRVLPSDRWNQLDGDVLRWRLEAGLTDTVIDQLFELRLVFEPEASRLAAANGTPEDHAAIVAAMDEIERLIPHARLVIAPDIAFHLAIIAATQNMFLISISDAIRTVLHHQFQAGAEHRSFPLDELKMHRQICSAILARNGDAAALLTERLIKMSQNSLAAIRQGVRRKPLQA
jgi:DNA-binding FadR family transcriptional regulator